MTACSQGLLSIISFCCPLIKLIKNNNIMIVLNIIESTHHPINRKPRYWAGLDGHFIDFLIAKSTLVCIVPVKFGILLPRNQQGPSNCTFHYQL